MTTQIISRFCVLLASILLTGTSFAQVSEFKNLKPVSVTGTHVKVYQNILDEFHKQFPGAENISWSKLDKNFLANFSMDDQNHMALFKPQAVLLYHISYGKEKNLPVDIRKVVKRMYVEFAILSAIKVEEASRTIWVITVEDDKNLVFLRMEEDDIEETMKYKKYNPQSVPLSGIVKQ